MWLVASSSSVGNSAPWVRTGFGPAAASHLSACARRSLQALQVPTSMLAFSGKALLPPCGWPPALCFVGWPPCRCLSAPCVPTAFSNPDFRLTQMISRIDPTSLMSQECMAGVAADTEPEEAGLTVFRTPLAAFDALLTLRSEALPQVRDRDMWGLCLTIFERGSGVSEWPGAEFSDA